MSSTQRFFIESEFYDREHNLVQFPDRLRHQVRSVLRLAPGDEVITFDGSDTEYQVILTSVEKRAVWGKIAATTEPDRELPCVINLYHSVLKAKAEAFVLQKGAELGVSGFFPFRSERTAQRTIKQEHAVGIVREACEVVGRVKLPIVHEVQEFADCFPLAGMGKPEYQPDSRRDAKSCVSTADGIGNMKIPSVLADATSCVSTADGTGNMKILSVLAWEEEAEAGILLSKLLEEQESRPQVINLIIGPEGGFSDTEVTLAKDAGVIVASLGKRILRAETATIAGLGVLLSWLGEM